MRPQTVAAGQRLWDKDQIQDCQVLLDRPGVRGDAQKLAGGRAGFASPVGELTMLTPVGGRESHFLPAGVTRFAPCTQLAPVAPILINE